MDTWQEQTQEQIYSADDLRWYTPSSWGQASRSYGWDFVHLHRVGSRQKNAGTWRHSHFYTVLYPHLRHQPPACGCCPFQGFRVRVPPQWCLSQKFLPRHTSLKPLVFLIPIKLTMRINHCANQVRILSKTPWLNTFLPHPAILGLWWFFLTSYKSIPKSLLPASYWR